MEYHVVEDAADLPFFILFQKKSYANSKWCFDMSTSQTKARCSRASAFRLLVLPGWNQNHGLATDCWKPEEMLLTLRMLEKERVANRVMRNVFLLVSWVAALLFPLRHFSLGRIGGGNGGTAANPPQGVRKGTQAISDAFTSTSNVLEGLPGVSAAPRFDSCQSYLLSADLQSIKFIRVSFIKFK